MDRKSNEKVRKGAERQTNALPHDKSVAECLDMGRRQFDVGHFLEAANIFSHILGRDPNNAEAMNYCGICMVVMGNELAGLKMMAQAVAIRPNSPKLHRDLGEMLRRTGRFQEAEASLRASLNLYPNNPDALSLLGLTQAQQGHLDEAMKACAAAVALDQSKPWSYARLAFVLSKSQRRNEARACLNAAKAINPGFDTALCLGLHAAEMRATFG